MNHQNLCMLGNFFMLLMLSADFFQKIQEHLTSIRVSNDLDPDRDGYSVGPHSSGVKNWVP